VSDELGLFAHPRPALHVAGPGEVVAEVARLVAEEAISEVIVGLPLRLSGEDSEQTTRVRALVVRLREQLPVPVTEWDERLTTVQASRHARGSARRRSGELDSAAAALVLQAALDARRPVAR
jgi:putative Holliday junction resolvase